MVESTEERPAVAAPIAPAGDQPLIQRLKARREELEQQHTETFTVPGYANVLLVELGMISWERSAKIQLAAEREARQQPHMQLAYMAASTILAATEQFHELMPDGTTRPLEGESWGSFARAVNPLFGDSLTERQYLIGWIGEGRCVDLFREYEAWRTGERVPVDKALRDFEQTG